MSASRSAGTTLVLLFLSGLTAGSAAAANSLIADAQESFDILDLEGAKETLNQALASPGNSDDDFKEIYSLLGQTNVLLDDESAAEQAFTNLLAYDRDYELPPGSPEQIQEVFDRVKASAPAHISKPRAGGGSAAALPPDDPPPMDDFSTTADDPPPPEDDLASLEAEAAANDDFGASSSTSNTGDSGGGGDDFDLASLEAEAAAAMHGEGSGGEMPPTGDGLGGGSDDPFGDSGGSEEISAAFNGGSEPVKVFPPQMREVSKDAPVELEVDLEDLSGVTQRVVMYYRQEGTATGFSTVEGQPLQPGKYFVKIPWIWDLSVGDTLALEYYLTALGAGDHVVGTYGSMGAPHTLRATLGRGMDSKTVVKQGEDPFYKKAWFWGLIGGVVAAGTATGLIVGLWPEETTVAGGALGKEKLSR